MDSVDSAYVLMFLHILYCSWSRIVYFTKYQQLVIFVIPSDKFHIVGLTWLL